MARGTLDSAALARLLVATIVGVVLSFLLVSVIARHRASAIDADTDGIVANAMPSVRYLSAARGALHRLDAYGDRYFESAERAEPLPSAPLREGVLSVDGMVTRYAALPTFVDEGAPQAELRASVAELDDAVTSLVRAADARGPRRDPTLVRFHSSAEKVDTLLERLVELNATRGVELGLGVRDVRLRTQRTVLLLDAVVVALALAATALALVGLRRSVDALEAANRVANERVSWLEERSSELDRFAGRVAHDVLSPLTSASLALGSLRRRFAGDAQAELVAARGLRGLAQSRQLVDGLLELARAGARPDRAARADVVEVLGELVIQTRAEADGTELRVEPFVPCTVACSPAVLASIGGNLVRNAVKHMGDVDERRVRVGITRLEGRCRVEVEDTGPGVPVALEQSIFEPFVRARTDTPGVGLGLATVTQLVSAHGGQVGYRRGAARGSIFWFELPLAREPREQPEGVERGTEGSHRAPTRPLAS